MTPDETRTVATALHNCDHRFLALRPADAAPASTAPGFLLSGNDLNALAEALDSAADYWPACRTWALIASDQAAAEHADTMRPSPVLGIDTPGPAGPLQPPTLRTLMLPVVLATFTT